MPTSHSKWGARPTLKTARGVPNTTRVQKILSANAIWRRESLMVKARRILKKPIEDVKGREERGKDYLRNSLVFPWRLNVFSVFYACDLSCPDFFPRVFWVLSRRFRSCNQAPFHLSSLWSNLKRVRNWDILDVYFQRFAIRVVGLRGCDRYYSKPDWS